MYSLVLMAAVTGGGAAPAHACYGFVSSPGCYPCIYYYYPAFYPCFPSYCCPAYYPAPAAEEEGSEGSGGRAPRMGEDQKEEAAPADINRKLDALRDKLEQLDDRLKRLEDAGKKKEDKKDVDKKQEKKPDVEEVSRAVLTVTVPADARVYLDNQLTRTANRATRTFITPSLEDGEEYAFTVRAEVVRDGAVQTESRRVIFRAGSKVTVSFPELERGPRLAARSR